LGATWNALQRGELQAGATLLKSMSGKIVRFVNPTQSFDFMTDDRRKKAPTRKNPTFAISILILVVVLLVIGTLFFNAIRDKREYERENPPAPANVTAPAAPAAGASQ
jgi:hypothetical protein